MAYDRIPQELKQLNQWVCWRLEKTDDGKDTKIPYNPNTQRLASHSDPTTWASFDACVAAANGGWYSGIGFVFSRNDPYGGVDLDKPEKNDGTFDDEIYQRQRKFFDLTTSYAELSPSGNGLHIIGKFRVPQGRKRSKIEVYSHDRYFTFTGNVYRDAPINDENEIVNRLWEEMGSAASESYYAGTATAEHFSDDLIRIMSNGKNGALFDQLFSGDWSGYSSQSEADQALMNIIAFYTQNRPQCFEIFRMSGLGQRDKAKRDSYVNYTLERAFDQMLPPIDMDGIVNQINAAIEEQRAASKGTGVSMASGAEHHAAPLGLPPVTSSEVPGEDRFVDGFDLDHWRSTNPPGLIRHMYDFTLAQAPRPVHEIALMSALALVAGISGRAYNVSGTGLNQYFMMLAPTGRGKEAMSSAINKALSAAVNGNEYPALWDFLGPADMASGSGLLKHLAERITPSFVSLTGEIGLRLQQMSSEKANMADIQLRRVLLDLYAKSGAGQTIRPTVYSDKKNNIEMIQSPAFTWLGESTPSEFYKALDESQIASGLLPRFTIVEYHGLRPDFNVGHSHVQPHVALTRSIQELGVSALTAMQGGKVINVGMTPQAVQYAITVNNYADWRINHMPDGPLVQLWNRHHLKVLKTAALLAVSNNPHQPMIDHHMVEWANSLCMSTTHNLLLKFERGEVGQLSAPENEQHKLMRDFIGKYIRNELHWLNPSQRRHHARGLISWTALSQGVRAFKAYREDRLGPAKAIEKIVADFVKSGHMQEVGKKQAQEEFKSNAVLYAVTNANWFLSTD